MGLWPSVLLLLDENVHTLLISLEFLLLNMAITYSLLKNISILSDYCNISVLLNFNYIILNSGHFNFVTFYCHFTILFEQCLLSHTDLGILM